MKEYNVCAEVRVLSTIIRQKVTAQNNFKNDKSLCGQAFILRFVAESGEKPVFQRDIERAFKLRRSTITATINKMEENGIIVRESVEYDSRLKRLVLTERGRLLSEECKARVLAIETEVASALTEKETEIFYNLIKKLQKKAEEIEQ